jgi:GT2 family glycosyltransferase
MKTEINKMENRLCAIIILNFNGKEYLKNCLNSIKKNTRYKNYKIVVVDNGSQDKSQKMMKSKFKWVDLIENKINRGFSRGNNDGIKYSIKKYNPKYFYLLNNDTLVEKNWLVESIKTMEKSKNTGIVGSKQLTFNKKPARSAGWIHMFGVNYYSGNIEKSVNWVSGAGFLIKKEAFNKIGLFDEIYNPAYYEETDLEERVLHAGFEIIHCPKSIFLHKGGQTTKNKPKYFSELFYRNRFIYFFKHYGLLYFLPRMFVDIVKQYKRKGIGGVRKLFGSYQEGYFLINKKEVKNMNKSAKREIEKLSLGKGGKSILRAY